MYRLAALLFTVACLSVLGGGVALAGGPTMNVNEQADEVNNDGDCSLREAMKASRENVAVDACAAGHPAGVDTIVLTGGLIYNLTVAGAGDDQGDLDTGGSGEL